MYRRLISLILSFVLILSIVPVVHADTVNLMSAAMNTTDETITISGYSSQKEVPIYILQKGKTAQDFKNDRSVLLNILQAQTDNNGMYSITAGYEGYTECTVCVAVGDNFAYRNVSASQNTSTGAGLGNIFGLPESFGPLSGSTTKERFESARRELTDEMPIYQPMEVEATREIYVSPGANGNGTFDNPYGKLSEAVAEAKTNPVSTVIYLREGIYGADQTATLSSVKSAPEFPLMISSYGDEEVVFTGGITLKRSDFEEVTDKAILEKLPIHAAGAVLSVNLKKLGITNYGSVQDSIFAADGVKYTLARYPDFETTGMIEYTGEDGENGVIDSGSIKTNSGSNCGAPRENGIKGEPGFEICVADERPFDWEINTDQIWITGSFYEEWSIETVKIKEFNKDKQSIRTVQGTEWGALYNPDNAFYYFNVLEEMNNPGEWVIDSTNGILYMYPHAEFENITFGNNTDVLISINNSNNIVINGIKFKDSASTAIDIMTCENILVQNCEFDGIKKGVSVSGESRFCGVINSVFSNIADYPIAMQHPSVTGNITKNMIPQYNFFQNNYVYGCDSVLIRGYANIVSHNIISNSKGTGIYSDRGHEIVIEYNEVAYGNIEIADSGAIYVGGNRLASGGNHVRYNYIHNCKENRDSAYGIYFDDFMSRSYIYNNIMEDTDIFLHNGSDNTVYNNIVINLKSNAIRDSTNYIDYFTQRWQTGALEYGAFTEFLDPTKTSVYIDVVSDASPYAIRYPTLKDWAEKMYERIAEYKGNGVVAPSGITVAYPNGTTTDLDTYLRSPRYNYYDKNVMVLTEGGYIGSGNGLSVTDKGKISAEIGTNKTFNLQKLYPKETNPFKSGYTKENFENVKNSYISGFETIEIDKIGLTDSFVTSKAPTPVFPAEGQIVELSDTAFKWISNAGNSLNTLKISASKDMSNPIISKTTVLSAYSLSDTEKARLTEGQTYYWQITSENKTTGVTGNSVSSDIYRFIVNSESLDNISGGILVYSIQNNSGDDVTDIAKEAALNVTAFAYNKGNKDLENVIFYAACYGGNENDILLSVKSLPVGTVKASSFTEDLIFNLTNTTGTKKIKLFMWDNNIKPLSNFEEVK